MTGANRVDRHVTGANVGRDFRVDRWEDLVEIREGDRCPVDGARSASAGRSCVGHIYQLGTKYSEPLEATFVDEDGAEQPYVMGCYGIGITRIMAAAAEQYHDDDGLDLAQGARALRGRRDRREHRPRGGGRRGRADLRRASRRGASTSVLDDREERAGVKFADADLIGYPVQVVVGKRGIEAGTVDLKLRATGERTQAPLGDAASGRDRPAWPAPRRLVVMSAAKVPYHLRRVREAAPRRWKA